MKPIPKIQIERLIKKEWKNAFKRKWPVGMTLKSIFQKLEPILINNLQRKESEAARMNVLDNGVSVDLDKNWNEDWYFFRGIETAENRNLKIDWVNRRLQKAIDENDLAFFIRFGNGLKRKPREIACDKTAFSLAFFWSEPVGKIPPLSYFTDDALVEILKILTGNEKLTFDQVRKKRQR